MFKLIVRFSDEEGIAVHTIATKNEAIDEMEDLKKFFKNPTFELYERQGALYYKQDFIKEAE